MVPARTVTRASEPGATLMTKPTNHRPAAATRHDHLLPEAPMGPPTSSRRRQLHPRRLGDRRGPDLHGHDEIRAWLARSASEYTYTIEMTGAEKIDDDHYDVTHHLEGDFPGGQVDLHFRFTLLHGRIARLVIEE